ncbi:proline-rich nuclear receptor coactivator 1 [Pelodiscus sinensis]|uniref:proline-rich nuclear receptor coactivator 1 n=1 Tax=Pelodiscus sinensis TaxID=13735 RepID=UPI003F6CFCC1
MVTTTAPPPFLARLSAGTEDARRLPPSLFQRLMRGDNNCETQASCCLAGQGGSARPALKRVRRRKGKIRPSPSGLLPSRYQQYQQHRAGLGRRAPLAAPGAGEVRTLPAPAAVPLVPAEEPPTSALPRPAPSKPLRKEFLKNKMGKPEKAPAPHCQPVHSTHLGEQSKSNKQKNKGNMPLTKIAPVKKTENNFWQLSVSPEIIDKQEKKLLTTESFRNMKSKKPGSPTEMNQKESYAGAKFSDPPSPSVLPKPPSHWVGCTVEYSDQNKELMAVHLKTLLKVQA